MYRVALNVAIYQLKVSKKRVLTVPIDGQVLDYQENDNSKTEEKWQIFRQKRYDEIAEIIGISSSNVGTKLSRIKEKLKTQILKKI